MRRTPTFLMMLTTISVLTPALAWAQQNDTTSTARVVGATTGNGRGFGLGTVVLFDPNQRAVPNILASWGDYAGRFHVEGLFGLRSDDSTRWDLGARGWYHIHAASAADFSLGAGFALVSWRAAAPRGRQYDFEMDLGAQIRAFIVPNVALLASLGFGIYLPDSGSTVFTVSGNIMDTVGLAYYF
jgi:hypothetical protein